MGCLVTDEIEVEQEPFCPPSIVSPPGADHPLDQIVRVNLSDGTELDGGTAEERFQVTVRDCNVEQDLEAILLFDWRPEVSPLPEQARPVEGGIRGEGSLERDFKFTIAHTELVALRSQRGVRPEDPSCHKMELRVSSRLGPFFQPDDDPRDIGRAIWWIAIPVGLEEPELRECP